MGWTVGGSNPSGGEIVRACPDRPWGPPNLLYNGKRVSSLGVKRRDVVLVTHPLLALRLRISWRYTPPSPLYLHRLVMGWPLSSTISKTLS